MPSKRRAQSRDDTPKKLNDEYLRIYEKIQHVHTYETLTTGP